MAHRKIVDAADAVALIQSGDVVASSGYGGNGTPEALFRAIENRILERGELTGLTLVSADGQGAGTARAKSFQFTNGCLAGWSLCDLRLADQRCVERHLHG